MQEISNLEVNSQIKRRMKIAIFTDTFKPCVNGIVDVVWSMAKGLKNEGHIVHLFALSDENSDEVVEDIVIHKFSSKRSQIYQDYMFRFRLPLRRVFKIAKKENFDILHSNLHLCLGMCALVLNKVKKIPLITTYHTFIPQLLQTFFIDWNSDNSFNKPSSINLLEKLRIDKLFYRSIFALVYWWLAYFNMGSCLLVPSNFAKEKLNEHGIGNNKTFVIPNPFSIEDFLASSTSNLNKELDIIKKEGEKTPILLYVGRLSVEKKINVLIKALKYLKYDYKCYIVGDGPIKDFLEQLAVREGVSEKVTFTGFLSKPELLNYYKNADIFVCPAIFDTFNNCIIEALYFNLPVIIDRNNGATDYVRHGVDGFIVDQNKPREYAKVINNLIENETLRKKIKQTPKNVQEMSIKNFVLEIQKFYFNPKKTKFFKFLKNIFKFFIGTTYSYIILIISDRIGKATTHP